MNCAQSLKFPRLESSNICVISIYTADAMGDSLTTEDRGDELAFHRTIPQPGR